MNTDSKPLFVYPVFYPGNKRAVFHTPTNDVEIEIEKGVINFLVQFCDGRQNLGSILKRMGSWKARDVRALLNDLEKAGVLVDSSKAISTNMIASRNPSAYSKPISERRVWKLVEKAKERIVRRQRGSFEYRVKVSGDTITSQLATRKSVRQFSSESCKTGSVTKMLWSAYGNIKGNQGVVRKTVPSAGALYPLQIYLVLQKSDDPKLKPGIYHCSYGRTGTVIFSRVSTDLLSAQAAFVDPTVLSGSAGFIVVAGSFSLSSEKYNNRAMPYMLLEAGHVAQNIHLSAQSESIATVEIGGFMESPLGRSLALTKDFVPLTTIIFGIESSKVRSKSRGITHVKSTWSESTTGSLQLPFFMSFSRVTPRVFRSWSCGRSINPHLALLKSQVEAKEWVSCSCVPDDLFVGSFNELDRSSTIHPTEIIRYSKAQYSSSTFPFRKFDDDRPYRWCQGNVVTENRSVHVLADQVYFPYKPLNGRKCYTQANSSGVAGHYDRAKAIENGMLELIERDSFMISYLSHATLPTIHIRSVPTSIQKRIRALRNAGFKICIKDASLDLAPVILVYAENEAITYATCAACASFHPEKALDHALMEVEAAIFCRVKFGRHEEISPRQVRHTSDHGFLYEQPGHYKKASFLGVHQCHTKLSLVGKNHPEHLGELMDRLAEKGFEPVTVDLSVNDQFGGNDGLSFVRSIIPGLVPISFGFNEEPRDMARLLSEAARIGSTKNILGSLPAFPHPYT